MSILALTSIAQAQTRPDSVEPELEIEVKSPIVRVVSKDYPNVIVRGVCNLTEQQRDIAWKNVLGAVTESYPEHSKYCARKPVPTTKLFTVVNDVCRAYVECEKTVDGVYIMRGHIIVEVDETTLEAGEFIDVSW